MDFISHKHDDKWISSRWISLKLQVTASLLNTDCTYTNIELGISLSIGTIYWLDQKQNLKDTHNSPNIHKGKTEHTITCRSN
jgi:hypothetical protein